MGKMPPLIEVELLNEEEVKGIEEYRAETQVELSNREEDKEMGEIENEEMKRVKVSDKKKRCILM